MAKFRTTITLADGTIIEQTTEFDGAQDHVKLAVNSLTREVERFNDSPIVNHSVQFDGKEYACVAPLAHAAYFRRTGRDGAPSDCPCHPAAKGATFYDADGFRAS